MTSRLTKPLCYATMNISRRNNIGLVESVKMFQKTQNYLSPEIDVADSQEKVQASATQEQATSDSTENRPDWQRIEALSSQIDMIARHWASRTGRDVEDIVQMMILAIAEQALKEPEFLCQKDNFILSCGSWRAVDELRKHWRDDTVTELDDELVGSEKVPERHSLDDIFQALSRKSQALLRTIIAAGDAVLKRNGTLNVSALARRLKLSNSTARRQVGQLRQELAVAGYRF